MCKSEVTAVEATNIEQGMVIVENGSQETVATVFRHDIMHVLCESGNSFEFAHDQPVSIA